MTQRSDNALVKRILAGDRQACVELIQEFHAPIYRLLVQLCRDAHLAEDLSQESFLAAWAKIGTFNGRSSLNTWLHSIAYRKFLDAQRRKQRTISGASVATTELMQSGSQNPHEQASKIEQSDRLHLAVNRLKPAEREVVVLHYLQGFSYEEMSEILSQPSGTVKWRTRQALENLRAALDDKAGQ